MKITIKYFASLADTFDRPEEIIECSSTDLNCVQDLKNLLSERGDNWKAVLSDKNTRCAVNQTIASETTPITGDCEVAFFPPVTGG